MAVLSEAQHVAWACGTKCAQGQSDFLGSGVSVVWGFKGIQGQGNQGWGFQVGGCRGLGFQGSGVPGGRGSCGRGFQQGC